MSWHYLNPLWYHRKAVERTGRWMMQYVPSDPERFLYLSGLFYGAAISAGGIGAYYFTVQYHWFWALPFYFFTAFIAYAIVVAWGQASKAAEEMENLAEEGEE